MGKKGGGWFSAVRKAFVYSNDSKENTEEKKPPQKTASKKSWFGRQTNVESESSQPPESAFATPALRSPPSEHDDEDKPEQSQAETSEPTEPESEQTEPTITPEPEPNEPAKPEDQPSKPTKPEVEPKKTTKPENEPSKPGYTSRVAVAAAAFRRFLGKSKEDIAAIKIQTAFRRFLARRKLRALKGLVRLKVLVQSQSVKRQAITTLRCMQTLARVQSQVRARRIRMSEENQALQRQLMQKRERELGNMKSYLGNEWDNTRRSKEQVVATMQHKEDATARRERALAYAQTQQQMWRNPSKSANPTFMDPNNPQWGWSWLDRWMASRPWESQSQTDSPTETEQPSPKITRSSSFGDMSQTLDRSPSISSPRSPAVSNRRLTLSGPKSINDLSPSPRNRRHSIANSSFQEDSTARVSSPRVSSPPVSSPRVSSPRVNSPRSIKTKSRIPSPTLSPSPSRSPSPSPLGSGRKGTTEKKPSTAPAKRRMSLSGPASTGGGRGGGGGGGGNRRLSMSSRVGSGTR
ncbi:putative IQ motif, EF-hand binding protein [Helianthus annuus]|uniref:IQ motif, EF-hand binding protein n=2 Tax=Helianthus annuus TaxID=4232 RepID=A0A9K3IEJ8_HELAN|nr:protein IQ-DOMAIN 1 [Helianthus annuus]KAF5794699.1 putative IQ motif, EF-hand binding protein [Helianthus annuus]KAJ0538301.1 putative IQ motif, EF-hand binding protein [Helianthus annuus]KAJ0546148.1 putative IQ motif, EF-hand binding protein [Helianthus annuus]KAJ0718613.1 putative IQ motif, EF-hand binding protein [Helianthus annuus]KAJ0959402.1 putative IQ motif, EF-hand binding protein [Helianthus annuus]